MEIEYLVFNNNKTSSRLLKIINESIKNVLKSNILIKFLKKNYHNSSKISLAIILIDKNSSKKLNQIWRKKNKIPDVLSFPMLDDDGKTKILGDIFLTTEKIAKENKNDLMDGFQKIILHGILHLLGFDHIKDSDYQKMVKLESKILKELNNI